MSVVLLAIILVLSAALRRLFRRYRDPHHRRIGFWARQIIHVGTVFLVLITLAFIWFDDPVRLATALGLITAGLAFALQRSN